jgi:hypothetical protein
VFLRRAMAFSLGLLEPAEGKILTTW